MTDWEPSEYDLNWIDEMLSVVRNNGGVWITSYAKYKKIGNTIYLKAINENYPNYPEDIERTEKTIKKVGYDYEVELEDE